MKNLIQQSYRGQFHLPQPNHSVSSDSNLLVLSFSWGEVNPFEQLNQSITSYYSASKNDFESTSPFEKILSLSPFANTVRTSILLANEQVYRAFNKQSYSAGAELSCVAINGNELVLAQVGNLASILIRRNKNILLTTTYNLSIISENSTAKAETLPPLPFQLLGVENICYPNIISINYEKNDSLFFISSNKLPENILSLNLKETLQKTTQQISSVIPDEPFWIGRIDL